MVYGITNQVLGIRESGIENQVSDSAYLVPGIAYRASGVGL